MASILEQLSKMTVVVCDTGDLNSIKKFTNDGTFVCQAGGQGSVGPLMRNPHGIDVGADGTMAFESETAETRLVLGSSRLSGAKAPLRGRVKALGPAGYAVGESNSVPLPAP